MAGAVTESKSVTTSAKGQLYAGMEKLAGAIAYHHFLTGGALFHQITIYGLTMDYSKQLCCGCSITMDFKAGYSSLKTIPTPFNLSDGINRLIATLIHEHEHVKFR